jgi:hypothetical protein
MTKNTITVYEVYCLNTSQHFNTADSIILTLRQRMSFLIKILSLTKLIRTVHELHYLNL